MATTAGQQLVSAEEMVRKLRAALDTRQEMVIIARTDARAQAGLDEWVTATQTRSEGRLRA
jgi:2-methylisocitrate lyase-like PEP mutase family enzyme